MLRKHKTAVLSILARMKITAVSFHSTDVACIISSQARRSSEGFREETLPLIFMLDNLYILCCNSISESTIMLHKNHRRRKFTYELLNLHTRIHINKVKWLVPHLQMRLLTKTFRYQNFFLLSTGKILYFFLKLCSLKIEFPQYGLKQAFVNSVSVSKIRQGST